MGEGPPAGPPPIHPRGHERAPSRDGDTPAGPDPQPVPTRGADIRRRALEVGDRVELRVNYSGGWSGGFDVAALVEGGYIIRRRNDGFLLPGPTGPSDVRHSSD